MTKTTLEKIYFFIIQWGVYLAFFTPLIFFKEFFFPFVVPKSIFFRIVVDIIFIAYVLLAVSNKKYRPRLTPLTIAILSFVLVSVVSSIFGASFAKSFWSVFERMAGLLTLFHLFAFYIVLTSVFQKRSDWEKLLFASILVGVFICLFVFTGNQSASRGGGTLGNTSFLSAYLVFDIFFAIIMFFTKLGPWSIFYGTSLTIFLGTLFLNIEPTRGVIGAFLGGIILLVLSFIYFLRIKNSGKIFIGALLLSFLVIFGVMQTDFAKGIMSQLDNFSHDSRGIVWKIAYDGWKERPLLGWGPENFNIPFGKYFNPELPLSRDVWYDRAHNIVFDTLVATGILGLLSYLSIFAVAVIGLFRLSPRVTEKKNLLFPLCMIALLATYFVQNLWVFDMISTYMTFFLSLAFIDFLMSQRKQEEVAEEKPGFFSKALGASLILVTLGALYFCNIQPARASMLAVKAIYDPLTSSVPEFEKAIALSPMAIFEIPEQISSTVINLAAAGGQDQAMLNKGYKLAEDTMRKNAEQNPQDYRAWLFLGRYYYNRYQFASDPNDIVLSEEALQKALVLSPDNQQTYWSLGQIRIFQKRYDEAVALMQKAIDLEPRYAQSHWYMALTQKFMGNYDLALQEAQKAEDLGDAWKSDVNDIKQVIEIYQGLGDTANAISLYEIAVTLSPSDPLLWMSLADSYAKMGETELAKTANGKAVSIYESAVQASPSNPLSWAGLAEAYAKVGEREKAKSAAEKLLELKPELKDSVDKFLKEIGY